MTKKVSARRQDALARYRKEPPVKDWKPRGANRKPRRRIMGWWVK